MKNRVPLIFVTLLLVACNQVDRIQSLSQLEPALRKHVGNPCKIDTMLEDKKSFISYNRIYYDFDNAPDVSFDQLVDFLSKAYNDEPVFEISEGRRRAKIVPLKDDSGAYMLQILEWYGSKDNKRHLSFCVIDANYELATPSSPVPQTIAPSK